MWANIAMQQRSDDSVSVLDMEDSFVSPLPSATNTSPSKRKSGGESRLVIEKRGNLLDYSTRNLSLGNSNHGPKPSPTINNNRKRQLLNKSFAWQDGHTHLNFDLTRSDSCASLSLQDLSVPFTELLGGGKEGGEEDDDETNNHKSTISNLPDFSTRPNTANRKKKTPLTAHGKSQSLHNPSFERSGIVHLHRSSIRSVNSATSAPADVTRRRTSDRKFLCKSLEQALAVRDNKQPEPVTEIKFRLKKRSRESGAKDHKGNTTRSKSIVMSDISVSSHHTAATASTSTKKRSSNPGVASSALQEMWKESRRETLKGILADPVLSADLNRTSLRSSFHVVAHAAAKQQSCPHRESVRAKKEARLHEAFNEGFSGFTMRDLSDRLGGGGGGGSPQRSPPPSKRKTMRAQRHSMMVGGNINPLSSLQTLPSLMDDSTKSAPTATSSAPATSQSKAYIMEYMKELLQTAAPKPKKRNVLKPKLKRASTDEPAKSIGSLSIASTSVGGDEENRSQASDTSSKAAAEIVALKALAGSNTLKNLKKGSLRRATTLPNLVATSIPSTSSHSRRSHQPPAKIPTSITVRIGGSCHNTINNNSVSSQLTNASARSTRSAPTSRRAQRAVASSSPNHLKPSQMQAMGMMMMPSSLVYNSKNRRGSCEFDTSLPSLQAMPDSNPGQVESYSSLPSIPDAPEEEQEEEQQPQPRSRSPRRRSSLKPDQRLTRTLSSMFQDFDDSMTSVATDASSNLGRRPSGLLRSSSWSSRKSMSLMIQMQDKSNDKQNNSNLDRRSSIRRKSRSFRMPSSGERRGSVLGSNARIRTLRGCAVA